MRLLAALLLSAVTGGPLYQVSPPAVVIDLDPSAVKGDPVQLTWSPTQGQFYLQTVEGTDSNVKLHHYLITIGSTKVESVKAEPDWAAKYWAFKSTRNVPGRSDLLIEVRETRKTGELPNQSLSDKAKGMDSGATAMTGAANAANDFNNAAVVRSLVLKNEVIGEFVDAPLLPGLTFGWSPEDLHAVAYKDQKGRLAVFDYDSGDHQEVDETRDVLLPAWSLEENKIAVPRADRPEEILADAGEHQPALTGRLLRRRRADLNRRDRLLVEILHGLGQRRVGQALGVLLSLVHRVAQEVDDLLALHRVLLVLERDDPAEPRDGIARRRPGRSRTPPSGRPACWPPRRRPPPPRPPRSARRTCPPRSRGAPT